MSNNQNQEHFCCVGDFPVLIPYRDLEKLVEIGKNYEAMEQRLSEAEKRLGYLHIMYTEALDKIAEIRRLILSPFGW